MTNVDTVREYLLELQERITTAIAEVDGGEFLKDKWKKGKGEPLQGDGTTMILEEGNVLLNSKVDYADVKVGAMIEIPSAVLTAEKIAAEVDFFELGTNDLVQYTLAVDRGNDAVSDWFRTLHPAVLFGINHTLKTASKVGIPAIVCGEMASTPAYAVLLAGMGADDLSMTPTSIPRVRATLSQIDTTEAAQLVDRCLKCATADEVEEIVRVEFRARWPEIFPSKALPSE